MNLDKAHTLVDLACLGMVRTPFRGVRHLLEECREILGKLFTRRNIRGHSIRWPGTWHGQCQSTTRVQWRGVDAIFRTMLCHAWPEVLDMRAALMRASQFASLARPHGRVVVPHIHVGASMDFFSPHHANGNDPYMELPLPLAAIHHPGTGNWAMQVWPDVPPESFLPATEIWLNLHGILILELPLVPDVFASNGLGLMGELQLPMGIGHFCDGQMRNLPPTLPLHNGTAYRMLMHLRTNLDRLAATRDERTPLFWTMLASTHRFVQHLLDDCRDQPLFQAHAWDVRDDDRQITSKDWNRARHFNSLLREFSGVVVDSMGLLAARAAWAGRVADQRHGLTFDGNPLEGLPRFWLAAHDPLHERWGCNILWQNRASLPVLYLDTGHKSERAMPFNCCQLLYEAVLDGGLPVQSLGRIGRVTMQICDKRQIIYG